MKAFELNALIRRAEERQLTLRVGKGQEYTRGAEDVLSNFKRVAEGCGLTPLQVWWVYFAKHVDAVASFVRAGKEFSGEPIEGRIDDLHVYLDLGYGLVKELKDARDTATDNDLELGTKRGVDDIKQGIKEAHETDQDGNPDGGATTGVGIAIGWHVGPLGRGADRKKPNGAFVEGVIQAAIGRLKFYQASKFACQSNADAIAHLELALEELEARTKDREAREVEGTRAV